MKTPLLIAARNEADYIGRTLASLDASQVEPIVAVNDSHDRTAQIARSYGATVYEFEMPGKLPALQSAVRYLGKTTMREPMLFTDADSMLLFSKQWPRIMRAALTPDVPGTVTGPLAYIDGHFKDRASNTYHLAKTVRRRWLDNGTFMTGNNMAVRFGRDDVAEEFLEMPHIWQGDDAAIATMVDKNGGTSRQLIHPFSVILTSTRHAITHQERKTLGIDTAWENHLARYADRAPAGSRPFAPRSSLGY